MNAFENIYGNKENIKMFSSLIKAGKLSHAYLIFGPSGSGKKHISLAVGASLASARGADERTCRRILDGHCPDVTLITAAEDKKTIGVDIVREFISVVALSPSELDFKMYIFDNAEKFTAQAQNALLKVIEEPPEGVYIFLLCNEPSSIIPTVRSRVQKVATENFSYEKLLDYYSSQAGVNVKSERFEFAARLCGGAIGKVRELISDDNAFELYNTVCRILDMQSEKMSGARYFDFLNLVMSAAPDREKLSLSLDFLLASYRDVMVAATSEKFDTSFLSENEAKKLSRSLAHAAAENSVSAVKKVKNGMTYNANVSISAAFLAQALWRAV